LIETLSWAAAVAPHAEHLAHTLANHGRGEIRPARPLTTNKALNKGAGSTPARPLRLSGPVTVERIIPNELWASVSAMLPSNPRHPRGGRSFVDDRAVLAGIVCVELLGCSWAKIPPTLGVSRYTCTWRLGTWRANGVWAEVRSALAESAHVERLAATASSV
jgi:transposase